MCNKESVLVLSTMMMTSSRLLLLLLLIVAVGGGAVRSRAVSNRFPDDFLFGAASASYQVEGGWDADGKGEGIWDRMFHEHPEFSRDGQNGDVADDSYHRYKEDVKLLKELGVNHYRFSISWPRIMPTGEANKINQPGIDYYNNLINDLLDNGIEPMVTMYHWDLPQWLQDLGGWTNPIIVDYFEDYARVLYETYGDRVKWWSTFNEPKSFIMGYSRDDGLIAPSIKKPGVGDYLATHHLLIAHARAYHLYDEQYRAKQQGKVSIALNTDWHEPLTNSTEDIAAADRAMQFDFGVFAHPIFSTEGDYPPLLRERIDKNSQAEGRTRSRLPVFSKEMVEYIRGTYDFLGLNYYSTTLVTSGVTGDNPSRERDSGIIESVDPSWPTSPSSPWLKVVPWGLRKLITWIHQNYNAPTIVITENGYSDHGTLEDTDRISYYKSHMTEVLKAMNEDGAHVIGYTAWSILDNLEWNSGYTERFGVCYVNISDPARPRTPKASFYYLKNVFQTHEIQDDSR